MFGSGAIKLSFAIARCRIGFSATKANVAATTLSTDATTNTAVQLPVAVANTLAKGTRRAAVPLAV
jgi:hypothetical protein